MDIQQHLDTSLTHLARVLDGIDPADDSRPTPCDGLDVASLRAHVLQALTIFVRGLENPQGRGVGGPGSVDGRGGDQVRDLARRIVATKGSQPGLLFLGGGGLPIETAFPMMLDEFLAHGWDLAVATDQPFTPDDETCDAATEFLRVRFPTDASRGTMYGPRVEVSESASALARFLGESGRDPHWGAA
ncbi:TIGR03086 family metal-binding protein [Gordonia terrae]